MVGLGFRFWLVSLAPKTFFGDHFDNIGMGVTAEEYGLLKVYSVPVEENPWRSRRASLSDYHFENVYICFRNVSNDMFVLQIDDVVVGQPPQFSVRSGYVKLDAIGDALPPGPDCSGTQHYGRMAVDEINGGLHICAESGWMYIPAGPASMSSISTQAATLPNMNTGTDTPITRSGLSLGE